jgi:Zn-dependent protease
MFASLKVGRVLGINLFIHWTFWLLPLWVVFTRSGDALISLSMNLLLLAGVFACVVLHELGHAVAARHFGIRTRRITLTPLGGMAQLERMSQKPWEEFCIAVAGPLVNVAIAAVLGPIWLGGLTTLGGLFPAVWEFLGLLLLANVVMIVFNLLPAFPMDGGRVLRAILAGSMGHLNGTRIAVAVGTVVAACIGLAGIFLLGNPWMLFIGLFVIFAGHQELRFLEMEERERLADAEAEAVTVPTRTFVWDPVKHTWVG